MAGGSPAPRHPSPALQDLNLQTGIVLPGRESGCSGQFPDPAVQVGRGGGPGRGGGGGVLLKLPSPWGQPQGPGVRKSSCVAVQLYVRLRPGGKQTPDLPSGAGECRTETGPRCLPARPPPPAKRHNFPPKKLSSSLLTWLQSHKFPPSAPRSSVGPLGFTW